MSDAVRTETHGPVRFVAHSGEVGIRDAVRERDRPFGDYGERSS